jgi:hypothetical protein
MAHDTTGVFSKQGNRVTLNWWQRSPRVGADHGRADLALEPVSDPYFAVGDVLGFCRGDEAGAVAALNAAYDGSVVRVFDLQPVHQQIAIASYDGVTVTPPSGRSLAFADGWSRVWLQKTADGYLAFGDLASA